MLWATQMVLKMKNAFIELLLLIVIVVFAGAVLGTSCWAFQVDCAENGPGTGCGHPKWCDKKESK
jgi:flagellar basal body-associated protein FliL